MAAISLSPLPPTQLDMSSRRVPLSSNQNAVNSPFRAVAAAAAASKQKRSHANVQREEPYGQPPPAKKQMLDAHQTLRTPPRQQSSQYVGDGKVLVRRSNATQPPTYERSRVQTREKLAQKPQQVVSRATKKSEEDAESVLVWQKHYKKLFPKYVFYFETVSEDLRPKYAKQVVSLGARVEKFFSNEVTHVVTTRQIPPELKEGSVPSSTSIDPRSENNNLQTINPILLDRSETLRGQADFFGTKGRAALDHPFNRKLVAASHDADVKKQQARNASNDVLHKARSLHMKIWALEKLQRIVTSLLESESFQVLHEHDAHGNPVPRNVTVAKAARGTDLSQMLRDERINGPSDRDPTVATREIINFKGPFMYIHDIDERQKPIMVREYAKVAHKEDGDWPQFRSVANGKCPFVDDDSSRREVLEREREARRQKQQAVAPRTRAATANQSNNMQPPKPVTGKRTLSEMTASENRNNVTVITNQSNPFEIRRGQQSHRTETEPSSSKGPQNAFVSRAGGAARILAGEPVASGVQPSNITSAIRSQVISSTAAQPGARAGTSREIHGLQRKVLEKNNGGSGSYGVQAPHRLADLKTVAGAKRSNSRMSQIEEDADPSEAEEIARKNEAARKAKAVQQRKNEKRDAKPGYCENCQDKFEDFEEHVHSRTHRKFAETGENWKDLDKLLEKLARPLRIAL